MGLTGNRSVCQGVKVNAVLQARLDRVIGFGKKGDLMELFSVLAFCREKTLRRNMA